MRLRFTIYLANFFYYYILFPFFFNLFIRLFLTIYRARNEIASAQEQLVREKEPQDILEQEYAALQKESAKLIQDTEELDV